MDMHVLDEDGTDVVLISLNAKDSLYYEYLRNRVPEADDDNYDADPNLPDHVSVSGVDFDNAWSESFNSKTDTKKRGTYSPFTLPLLSL